MSKRLLDEGEGWFSTETASAEEFGWTLAFDDWRGLSIPGRHPRSISASRPGTPTTALEQSLKDTEERNLSLDHRISCVLAERGEGLEERPRTLEMFAAK